MIVIKLKCRRQTIFGFVVEFRWIFSTS